MEHEAGDNIEEQPNEPKQDEPAELEEQQKRPIFDTKMQHDIQANEGEPHMRRLSREHALSGMCPQRYHQRRPLAMCASSHLWLMGLLLLLVWASQAQAQNPACFSMQINAKGSSGAAITVDATAGGIVIADANSSRCALTIINETANPMRCAPSTGKYALVVSATVGAYIPAGTYPVFGRAAQEQWKCARTSGTSATITTIEDLP